MLSQLFVTVAVLAFALACEGCTNFLASRGAVQDSSTIVAYNADSSYLYGSMYSYPAQKNIPAGTMRQIFDWDSGTCVNFYHSYIYAMPFSILTHASSYLPVEIMQMRL